MKGTIWPDSKWAVTTTLNRGGVRNDLLATRRTIQDAQERGVRIGLNWASRENEWIRMAEDRAKVEYERKE